MVGFKHSNFMVIVILSFPIPFIKSSKFNIPEDARLNFTELGHKYGLVVEEHDVTTEDGYILKLFHISGDKSKPVLLVPGLFDTGDTYILRGNTSLSVALANAGYDIWILTPRGVTYSRRHVTLKPDKDKEFWDFSFHETGYYDLPITIDYILSKTGSDKLSAIAHSLGNTIFYVLGATKPEYNHKIKILIALGPVCYCNNYEWPTSVVIGFGVEINRLLMLLNIEEIFDDSSPVISAIRNLCSIKYIGYDVCGNVFFAVAGYDVEEFEPEAYYIVIGHYLRSASRKTIFHLVQVAQRATFSQFDYGFDRNLEMYNSKKPPNYDLGKVTMPVALVTGINDKLSPINDVKRLAKELPNLIELRIMKNKKFNHIDHIWGRNMKVYLFPHIFKILEKYS